MRWLKLVVPNAVNPHHSPKGWRTELTEYGNKYTQIFQSIQIHSTFLKDSTWHFPNLPRKLKYLSHHP